MNIKKYIPTSIKDFLKSKISTDHVISFHSQSGEDVTLKNLFGRDFLEKNKKGFYVDIGAYHPKHFSNTFYFYQNGWRGINIDGSKESILLFDKFRLEDRNVHAVISNEEIEIYFPEKIGSMNTISTENTGGGVKIKSEKLSTVLNKYVPKNQVINFMSIDVEGHEIEILRSNDWEKYRPMVLLVEIEGKTVQETLGSEVLKYIESLNYKYIARTYVVSHIGTSVFVDNTISLP